MNADKDYRNDEAALWCTAFPFLLALTHKKWIFNDVFPDISQLHQCYLTVLAKDDSLTPGRVGITDLGDA